MKLRALSSTALKQWIVSIFYKGVLKTSCKCRSAVIRSSKIEKQKYGQLQWRGRWREREVEREDQMIVVKEKDIDLGGERIY